MSFKVTRERLLARLRKVLSERESQRIVEDLEHGYDLDGPDLETRAGRAREAVSEVDDLARRRARHALRRLKKRQG